MKNRFREMSHKPRILKVYHFWVCATHNARGEGSSPKRAYKKWKWSQEAYERSRLGY